METDILAPSSPDGTRGGTLMGSELDVALHGPHAGMDAADTLRAMKALLDLLEELERTETALKRPARLKHPHKGSRHTRWTFAQLGLGSTRATLAPLKVPAESSYEQVDRIMLQTVAGFAAAESVPGIPRDWTAKAAELGASVARTLGASPDVGMHLAIRSAGTLIQEAEVTERARRNLRNAVKTRYSSLGSRRGHLGGLSDAKGLRAVLWSEAGHERIPLVCKEEHREQLRQAWGRDRVEITGQITENAQGQVVSIKVEEIELLHTEPALSFEDLNGGFWPDMTGGRGALEHLAVLRGEA